MKHRYLAIISLLFVLVLVFTLCACSGDVSYIAEHKGERIAVSEYSLKLFSAISAARDASGEKSADVEDILSHDIDGTPAEKWVEDEAMRLLREQIAVDAEFERLGLTLSDEDIAEADASAAEQWSSYSEVYAKNGVTEQSLTDAARSSYKLQYIFDALYAEGGEKALSQEELAGFFTDYQLFRLIGISKLDEDGEKLDEDELEEQLEKAKDYQSRLESGEDGDKLTAKAEEELAELTGDELGHSHDPIESHISIAKTGELYYSVEVMELIESLKPGDVELFEEDESFYIVIQKLSALDAPELLEQNRLPISYELHIEDFDGYIAELTEAVELLVNADAVKFYSPRTFVID